MKRKATQKIADGAMTILMSRADGDDASIGTGPGGGGDNDDDASGSGAPPLARGKSMRLGDMYELDSRNSGTYGGDDDGWRDLLLPPAVAGDSGTGWWAVALDGAEPGGDYGLPVFDEGGGSSDGGRGGGRGAMASRGTDTVSLDIAAIEDESFR